MKADFLVRNQYTLLKHLKPGGSTQVVYPIQLPPGEWTITATQDLNECLVRLFVDRNKARAPLGFSGWAFCLLMDLIGG